MQNIYLVGADEVSRAGSTIRSAADSMQDAARNIEGSLVRHQQFLDDWLNRLAILIQTDSRNE